MLSETKWAKLLPEIRKTLEQTQGPTTRWGHRRLQGYLLQLVAELEETRRALKGKGWEHPENVLEKIRYAADRLASAARGVEDAVDKARDAAEDLVDPLKQPTRNIVTGNQEPWGSVSPAELLDHIKKIHSEQHPDSFRFCSDPICAVARYTA